jgi:parallel beta-helix repeat protein
MILGGKMYKKLALFMIFFIILGALFSPLIQSDSVKESNIKISNGKTLYVGGIGPGNYSKIKDAIKNASDGDTVYVFSGTYNETLYVNKSIGLIGENKSTTIIGGIGSYDVVYIINSWASVQNFTIKNSGKYGTDSGIKINGVIHNISIKNNIISDNKVGICVGDEYSNKKINHVSLEGNIVKDNFYGVTLYVTYFTRISNNTFIRNGLFIPKAYTRDNIVLNNTVNGLPLIYLVEESNKAIQEKAGQVILVKCNNITISSQQFDKTCDVCIELFSSRDCNIFENNISNKCFGIYLLNSDKNNLQKNSINNVSTGFYLSNADKNEISLNSVKNCLFSIFYSNSDQNAVSYNSFSKCRVGMKLYDSNYNLNSFNLIDNCSEDGIYLSFSCNFNQFLNNTIKNCRYKGIYILGSTQIWWDTASNKNVISGNHIENNSGGIYLDEASLSEISMNHIVKNNVGINVISSGLSKIYNNNIFDNKIANALIVNSFTSRFKGNFWNEKVRIHAIPGGIYRYDFRGDCWVLILPLMRFDFHAVKKPYNIGGFR